MTIPARRTVAILLSIAISPIPVRMLCQDAPQPPPPAPAPAQTGGQNKPVAARISKVTNITVDGRPSKQIEIDLQGAPPNADPSNVFGLMEPAAEPRRIRIDDRHEVRFLLENLSPLDVCTRSTGTPTPTAETPVGESLVSSVAGLGAFSVSSGVQAAASVHTMDLHVQIDLDKNPAFAAKPDHRVQKDAEFKNVSNMALRVLSLEKCLIQGSDVSSNPQYCGKSAHDALQSKSQASLASEMDDAGRFISDFTAQDFRGPNYGNFDVKENLDFDSVKAAYDPSLLVPLVTATGSLQAMVDEMTIWSTDLHKKYGYKVADSSDASAKGPQPPPIIYGVLTVAPTDLGIAPGSPQTVMLASGGRARGFTASVTSDDANWLQIGAAGSATPPSASTLSGTTPDRGTFNLILTVAPGAPTDGKDHRGRIEIRSSANNTTFINVSLKQVTDTTQDDLDDLATVSEQLDQAKAGLALIGDNTKGLESAQTTIRTAYVTLVKVEDDYLRRRDVLNTIFISGDRLAQNMDIGTDRKSTSAGYISCVSSANSAVATTTNLNYVLLYQNIPNWTASAGLLVSFLPKQIIGLTYTNTMPGTTTPTDVQAFAVTDYARAQVLPMIYANRRIVPYKETAYGKYKEDQLVWTFGLSAGFGLNPNTGTTQPEFFTGAFIGLNRLLIHPGVHFGRQESLAGGYSLNTPFPTGSTVPSTVPLSWSYKPYGSIGFSVRVAPY